MTKLLYTDKADLTLGILPLFVVLDKDEEQPLPGCWPLP